MAKSLTKRRVKRARRLRNQEQWRGANRDMDTRARIFTSSRRAVDTGLAENLIHIRSLRKMYGMGWHKNRGTPEERALLALFAAVEAGRARVHSLYFRWEPLPDGTWIRRTLYRSSFIPQMLPMGWSEVRRWHDSRCRLWILREAELSRVFWKPGQECGPPPLDETGG